MNTDHRAGKINQFFLIVKNIPDSMIMPQQISNKLSKPPSIWLCCQPTIKIDNKPQTQSKPNLKILSARLV
jgi:hypothetical protein